MQPKFIYTPAFEEKLRIALSPERLYPYEQFTGGPANFASIISLYTANTALSEGLYGPLQVMEITVRNAINDRLLLVYGDDWYLGGKISFDQTSLSRLTATYRKYRGTPGLDNPKALSSKIVSSQTLGFWTNLFKKRYEDPLWRRCLRAAFAHAGGPLTRSQVFEVLDKSRRLRNRIAHHEPIIGFDLESYYNDAITVVAWVNPIAAIWLTHHNRFYDILEQYKSDLSPIKKRATKKSLHSVMATEERSPHAPDPWDEDA